MASDDAHYFGVHALHVWRIYQDGDVFSVRVDEEEIFPLSAT